MTRLAIVMLTLGAVVSLGCGGAAPAEPNPPASPRTTGLMLDRVPEQPDPTASYLIYLHGAIVETGGLRPRHPRFGTYEYAMILEAFANRGFHVISEVRPAGTRPGEFAQRVADQIRQLSDRGVPEKNITVVGFSKGGAIAILASSQVQGPDVRWVFLAACGPWLERQPDIVPHGRLLSLYDRSDEMVQSCQDLFDRMPTGSVTAETVLDLDLAHGAFYTPKPAWIEPVIDWSR